MRTHFSCGDPLKVMYVILSNCTQRWKFVTWSSVRTNLVRLTFYVLWIVLKTKNNRICESIKEREGATFWIIETSKTRPMCKKCTSLTLTIHSISISYFSSYTSAFSKRNYQMFWYIGHKYRMIVQKMYLTALAGQWPNPYCHLHHVFINTKKERTTEDMKPEVSKK